MITDVFEFLCDLAEASDESFRTSAFDHVGEPAFQLLRKLGAIEEGPRPDTVTCSECDMDHPAAIEFDAARHCYVHFCPEAGLVTVPNTDLASFLFRPGWLVNWLAQELHAVSRVKRIVSIANDVWHLGDAQCDDTLVTIVFARQVSSQTALDYLASALGAIHLADKGLVMTTSPQVVRQVPLPYGFEFLDLREIGRLVGERLIVDHARLGSFVQGLSGKAMPAKREVKAPRKGRREPARLDFREADKPLLAEMDIMIREGKARNVTDAARALASRAAGSGKGASKVTRLASRYVKVDPNG